MGSLLFDAVADGKKTVFSVFTGICLDLVTISHHDKYT